MLWPVSGLGFPPVLELVLRPTLAYHYVRLPLNAALVTLRPGLLDCFPCLCCVCSSILCFVLFGGPFGSFPFTLFADLEEKIIKFPAVAKRW